VRQFVDTIHSLLLGLEVVDRQRHLLLLTCLVGPSLQDTYRSLVLQACAASSHQVVKKEERVDQEKRNVRPTGLSEGTGLIRSEEVLAHSSKRAKLLLSASQQTTTSHNENSRSSTNSLMASLSQLNSNQTSKASAVGAKRPAFLSELNSVPGLALVRPKTGSKAGTSEKVTCGVCNVVSPINPCANKCGHIICEACWTQWLLNNNTCPFCRKPASMQTITRLNITR
jgi:hypothetical protein